MVVSSSGLGLSRVTALARPILSSERVPNIKTPAVVTQKIGSRSEPDTKTD
jgi:hypothetical protein